MLSDMYAKLKCEEMRAHLKIIIADMYEDTTVGIISVNRIKQVVLSRVTKIDFYCFGIEMTEVG